MELQQLKYFVAAAEEVASLGLPKECMWRNLR
jgi:hypothetical protein